MILVPFEIKHSPIYSGTGKNRKLECYMNHGGYHIVPDGNNTVRVVEKAIHA